MKYPYKEWSDLYTKYTENMGLCGGGICLQTVSRFAIFVSDKQLKVYCFAENMIIRISGLHSMSLNLAKIPF